MFDGMDEKLGRSELVLIRRTMNCTCDRNSVSKTKWHTDKKKKKRKEKKNTCVCLKESKGQTAPVSPSLLENKVICFDTARYCRFSLSRGTQISSRPTLEAHRVCGRS